MKIKIFSDLHLEFRQYLFDHIHLENEHDTDTTLCLSGDISTGTTSKPFIEEMCKHFKHVLYVPGNHEFYHNDFKKVISNWQEYEDTDAPDNFHFLYNDWRILDGVRFIGGTMWTNFGGADEMSMFAAHRMMADYSEISLDGKYITPDFVLNEHNKFMNFLQGKLSENFDGPTVVMTHHSPGNELKRKGHRQDRVGCCYFADIEDVVGEHPEIKLFTHGHTHQNWDYMINETRVVCNPYGYWGYSTNKDFDRDLLIEI